jgi:hypothetical protein
VTDTIYIDIIAVIAQKKLDYAINKIIFDLLRSEPFCPEYVRTTATTRPLLDTRFPSPWKQRDLTPITIIIVVARRRVGIGIQSLLTIVTNLETGSGLRDSNSSQSGPHLPQRPPAAIQEYMYARSLNLVIYL